MADPMTRLDFSKAQVLAIEDSPQAMDILSQILMGFGAVRAVKCLSFADAGTHLDHASFDLVLADDDPLTDHALQFLRRLRSDPQSKNYTVPAILMGYNISQGRSGDARDAGASFIVAKPLAPAVLLDRIEWIARSQRKFVTSNTYRGPDRRFKTCGLPIGVEERRADTLKLMAAPERQLGQHEIDSLFS